MCHDVFILFVGDGGGDGGSGHVNHGFTLSLSIVAPFLLCN